MFHIIDRIQNSQHHTQGLGCSFLDVELISETINDFACYWTYKCKMCNLKTIITSEKQEPATIPLNKVAVKATIETGIGYTQLAELAASLEIPCLSVNTYNKYNETLSADIKGSSWDEMWLAGLEEKKLALELGDVDKDGISMCPGIAVGQWSKRSYKTKYDALSGAVRNKMIHISSSIFVILVKCFVRDVLGRFLILYIFFGMITF